MEHAVGMRILPGQNACARRPAQRIRHKPKIKTRSVLRDPIHVRGVQDFVAVSAHRIAPLVVGEKE